MAEDFRIGFVTQDFALRVVVPSALVLFLLSVVWPGALSALAQSPVAGVLGFLVLGTLSYVLYRGLYVAVLSRIPFMAPQLVVARDITAQVTQQARPWAWVRAIYIEWREVYLGEDARAKYVSRLAPYVHGGYQSALIFFVIGGLVAVASGQPIIGGVLVALGVPVFLASAAEDRELNLIERDLLRASRNTFTSLLHQTIIPVEPRQTT